MGKKNKVTDENLRQSKLVTETAKIRIQTKIQFSRNHIQFFPLYPKNFINKFLRSIKTTNNLSTEELRPDENR